MHQCFCSFSYETRLFFCYRLRQGFYTVYRKVFETIAAEDIEYRDDADGDEKLPGFGDSTSSYEEVRTRTRTRTLAYDVNFTHKMTSSSSCYCCVFVSIELLHVVC